MRKPSTTSGAGRPKKGLSHVAPDGSIRMVDMAGKAASQRTATAQAIIRMNADAMIALRSGMVKKGDALAAARVAGILAAKRTGELIPLCHTLILSRVDVQCAIRGNDRVIVTCNAAAYGPTGVEMEALTGATVAALTLYDMCKALDRAIDIEHVRLMKKSGGRSGTFVRHDVR